MAQSQTPRQARGHAVDIVLSTLSIVAGVAAFLTFLYYWDPTRLVWKRWMASSPTLYEEVDPRLLAVDPADFITVRSEEALARTRQALIQAIWGRADLPPFPGPATIERVYPAPSNAASCPLLQDKLARRLDCNLDLYRDTANLAAIDRLAFRITDQYVSIAGHFIPRSGNGKVVIYQHGYAGTYHDQWRHIARLVAEGYAVLALNLPAYGENAIPAAVMDEADPRIFIDPALAAAHYATERLHYRAVAMLGLSAGAWVTVMAAAVEPEIIQSYAVAGVLPVYLRREKETAPPQLDSRLLQAADYLDIYVLGTSGVGRSQMQIFNRFDRCCFAGPRGLVYEEAVQEAVAATGAGRFQVILDETHARHKISAFAMDHILTDLARLQAPSG